MRLEKAVNLLLKNNPFYAHFFMQCQIRYTKDIPTAGASLGRSGPILYFNMDWMASLSIESQCAVIEHEILHILFEHILVVKEETHIIPKLANIAMDCTINQYIENLPKEAVTLAQMQKICKADLEAFQTWEYYYSKLLQSPNVTVVPFDSHDKWEEGEKEDGKPMSQSEKQAAVKAAAGEAVRQSKGNLPQGIDKVLDALNTPSKLSWKQLLSNFVARNTASLTINTRKKANRRYGFDFPGKKKKRELTLGVCVDSSGSINDEDFTSFLNEVCRISSLCKTVYLIDADCQVQSVQVLKKGKKPKFNRNGSGGTAYQPAIDECIKRNCDAIVYFGDFDTSDTPENPNRPFLWVGVGNQEPPGSFGSVVRL